MNSHTKKKTPNKLIISFLNAFSSFIQWYDNYFSQLNNSESPFKIENCCKLIDELNYEKSNNIILSEISSLRLQRPVPENYVKQKHEKQKVPLRDWMGKIIGYQLVDEEGNIEVDEEECFEYDMGEEDDNKREFRKINKNAISKKFSEHNEIIELKSEIQRKDELLKKEQLEKEKLQENEKTLRRELAKKDEEIENNKRDYNLKMDLILKNLAENSKMFEKCMDIFNEHIATAERIETKIDAIDEKINHLTNQISAIQSFAERQIKNATSNEQVERILEDFMEDCIDKIMSVSSRMMENENYEREKRKLIRSMGKSAWMKLSERSKSFLITSKVMYNDLILIDDVIDYSGICVLVTKALEVEVHFTGFLDFLHEKYDDDYSKYHSALLFKNKRPMFPEKFTMGDIAFVLCHIENWNDTQEQKAINKERLMDYCRSCIFSKYNEEEIERLLNYYASSIETIRTKYRNPSAHTNEIKQVDAEECFDLVLDVEKLLKEMLDSFDN